MDIEIQAFTQRIGAREHTPRFKRSNYFVLYDVGIIIKISRAPNLFWGIGKYYVDAFNAKYEDYFVVLLTSADQGYLFDKSTVNKNIFERKWKFSQSDYKISSQLRTENRFNNPEEFLSKSGLSDLKTRAFFPEEVPNHSQYYEGASHNVSVNVYERNSEARKKCIEHYGYVCSVCGFDFYQKYGVLGLNFIHVHHLLPLSEINNEYKLRE